MKRHILQEYARVFTTFALLVAWVGCAKTEDGEIPITTSSDEAKTYYLQGRSLSEKLLGQDARQYFEQAVAKDHALAAS